MPKTTDVLEMEQPTELQKMQQELDLFKKMFLAQKVEPREIVHEVKEELVKPKRVLFTINALEDEDAKFEDGWIPGKAIVGAFKFVDELKCDAEGNRFTTGFEVDELEFRSGLEGEDLAKYQEEVRIARRWIERMEGANLDSSNKSFWQRKKLKLDALGFIYDTDMSTDNLLIYYNILGGGYPSVARSYEEAKENKELLGQRLYISVQEVEAERNFDSKRTLIKANSKLEDILDNWKAEDALYLMYSLPIKKYLGYTKNTPRSLVVEELSNFVDGIDTTTEKRKRPKQFLDSVKLIEDKRTRDTVVATALFNAAVYYGYIFYHSKERFYKNRSTEFEYGNNPKTAVEHLLNPKNEEERAWLLAKVNEKWNN